MPSVKKYIYISGIIYFNLKLIYIMREFTITSLIYFITCEFLKKKKKIKFRTIRVWQNVIVNEEHRICVVS